MKWTLNNVNDQHVFVLSLVQKARYHSLPDSKLTPLCHHLALVSPLGKSFGSIIYHDVTSLWTIYLE